MKKWKIIKYVTLSILILFLIYILWLLGICINDSYPSEFLGATVHNWFEAFIINLVFKLIVYSIPLLLVIILFIVSIKKTKIK